MKGRLTALGIVALDGATAPRFFRFISNAMPFPAHNTMIEISLLLSGERPLYATPDS